jgi:hypothetical protein
LMWTPSVIPGSWRSNDIFSTLKLHITLGKWSSESCFHSCNLSGMF